MREQTTDPGKVAADACALYGLYQIFGRGRVTEYDFVAIYLRGNLPEFIKRVMEEKDEQRRDHE